MADGVISFPFRLTPQGTVATVPRGSDQEVDEALAVITLTLEGERLLTPGFGIPDPVFYGINAGDIQTCLDEYGPENVVVETVDSEPINDTQVISSIAWSYEDEETEEEE